MPGDIENRDHERREFVSEIELEFASGKRAARISDISMGGCYVDSIVYVTQGEAIAAIFRLPSGQSMRFTGEVAYVFPGLGFGIRFTDLSEEMTIFLVQMIRSK
jgi:hypothetical protein